MSGDSPVPGNPDKCPRPDKQRHETKALAWDEARATRKKTGGNDILPYECQCGAWHVGHDRSHFEKRVQKLASLRKFRNSQRRRHPKGGGKLR